MHSVLDPLDFESLFMPSSHTHTHDPKNPLNSC